MKMDMFWKFYRNAAALLLLVSSLTLGEQQHWAAWRFDG